jgi:hypothetical protein
MISKYVEGSSHDLILDTNLVFTYGTADSKVSLENNKKKSNHLLPFCAYLMKYK